MLGSVLNAAAIVLASALALMLPKNLPMRAQMRLKVLLGAFTAYVGLAMALNGFGGGVLHRFAQFAIALLALMLGKLTGQVCRFQRGVNVLGRLAQQRVAQKRTPARPGDGFLTGSIVFCLGPLAILGALQEGLFGSFRVLIAKSVLDGLAAFAFVQVFGWGVMLAAIPVLAYQGSITLAAEYAEPYLRSPAVAQSISLTAGLLVFSVCLMMLDLRKVAVADYLPSLAYAPLLTHFCLRG